MPKNKRIIHLRRGRGMIMNRTPGSTHHQLPHGVAVAGGSLHFTRCILACRTGLFIACRPLSPLTSAVLPLISPPTPCVVPRLPTVPLAYHFTARSIPSVPSVGSRSTLFLSFPSYGPSIISLSLTIQRYQSLGPLSCLLLLVSQFPRPLPFTSLGHSS